MKVLGVADSRRLPTAAARGFDPMSGHVGFVVDRVALGQISPLNSNFADFSTLIYQPGLVQ
jgi:hypothetical protein